MDVVTLGAALNGAKKYTDATIAPLLGGVHYRGSVNYFSDLPNNAEEGDAYTVKYTGTTGTTPDGGEYVWGKTSPNSELGWISFSKDAYSKAETDALLAAEQEQINENKTNILSEQGKTTGMSEGGSNYITVNGIRVYVSATAPTGARTGDLWIGG